MSDEKYKDLLSEIIERRLNGEPIMEIAGNLGVSRQYLYSLFATLPRDKDRKPKHSDFDIPTQARIVREYLSFMPSLLSFNCEGEERNKLIKTAVGSLAKKYGCTDKDILQVLYRMTSHHASVAFTPYYSNLYAWRSQNSVGLNELSEIAKVSSLKMREILRGWRHLPLDAAKRIKKASGLTITQIYSDLIELDRRAGGGAASE